MDWIYSKEQLVDQIQTQNIALHGDHIMFFQYLLQKNFNYEFFCSNNELQVPEAMVDMVALNSNQKHIQILFKPLSYINISEMGHWVCSYYDTQNIFICDSATIKTGHINYDKVLHKLFPSYFLKGGCCLNNNVLNLKLKNDGKTSHDFKELMNLQQSINKKYLECKNYNQRNEHVVQVDLKQNVDS
ncbi:unnamed protein product [Macrosiphum euphorbiae]|uniref:Ubiquitin-like protease family profile domain-containing protein n=1 Tax=Macrosiphum euphorbiae TaxID=13131 RepID=A0AAV0WVR1_9HEMI|nr:unnamed protein product [Macrosiphum euphorbiae]